MISHRSRIGALATLLLAAAGAVFVPARADLAAGHSVIVDSSAGYVGCLDAEDIDRAYCVTAYRVEDGVRVVVATFDSAQPSGGALWMTSEDYLAPANSLGEVDGALGGPAVELDAELPQTGRVHIVSQARTISSSVGVGPGRHARAYTLQKTGPDFAGPWPIGFQTLDTGSIGGVAVHADFEAPAHDVNANFVGPVSGAFCCY